MNGKMIVTILAVLVVVMTPAVLSDVMSAAPGTEYTDGDFRFQITDGCAVVTGLVDDDTENAEIPSKMSNEGIEYPVKTLGNGCFMGSDLMNITLPDGLVSIGDRAFADCEDLAGISIPSSITSIGTDAFSPASLCMADGTVLDYARDIVEISGHEFLSDGENMFCRQDPTPTEVTVSFDTAGGSAMASVTGNPGDAMTVPPEPMKEGFTFAGWEPAVPDVLPAEDLVITANWTANTYTITFDTNGGQAVDAIELTFGAAVESPAVPEKTGFTFNGWEPALPATMPAHDIGVSASWTETVYTITFDTNGGSAVPAMSMNYGDPVESPSIPQKEGYEFAGWEPALPETMPAEDLSPKAVWKAVPRTYTITFETDGGSNIGAMTFEEGSAIAAPGNPSKEGYEFVGWEPAIPENMPGSDMTVTAQWEKSESILDRDLEIRIPSFNEIKDLAYGTVDTVTDRAGMERLDDGEKDILFLAIGILAAIAVAAVVRRIR